MGRGELFGLESAEEANEGHSGFWQLELRIRKIWVLRLFETLYINI
jgi:hypothetical protein